MKIAIISDIHGNLEALETVLSHINKQKVDKIVCLGDIVGYGSNPNECAEIIREKCQLALAGNHDFAAADKTDISYFNPYAKEAVMWTRRKLTPENLEYISNLPLDYYEEERIFVHAIPSNPGSWGYIMSNMEASREFRFFAHKVCFVGHSHSPVVIEYKDNRCKFIRRPEFHFEDDKRYIVNVGSVGQPRDGDPKACYITYDVDSRYVQYYRLKYDLETTQKKIHLAGLPKNLANRLEFGR
ncbi:MAG: hypothetical protein B6244_04815 [Candidatus Cloacimonetes bacterium 4572_55]|nr:MAG: hypothetical protein B6244_04815 [Candidatus Cloacimonetes bacterium 4572_55]